MSLVAYEASSDEESDNCEDDESEKLSVNVDKTKKENINAARSNVQIDKTTQNNTNKKILQLPPAINLAEDDNDDEKIDSIDILLPAPSQVNILSVEEQDDEFLRKKAIPVDQPPPIKPPQKRTPVRITIPSLSDFQDDEKPKNLQNCDSLPKSQGSGLLSILPKPKTETLFKTIENDNSQKLKSMIPYSVANRQKNPPQKKLLSKGVADATDIKKTVLPIANYSDSDDSDGAEDFFSLNVENKLPEISANEINVLVAKKAAKMAETASKFDQMIKPQMELADMTNNDEEEYQEEYTSAELDDQALHALCGGSRAKRAKYKEVNIVDISGEEVLPRKDEWLRSSLAAATEFQPKSRKSGDDPSTHSKKKHQITYLAHQAKANEQELQAMWSANRQTRRQTQSKYGF